MLERLCEEQERDVVGEQCARIADKERGEERKDTVSEVVMGCSEVIRYWKDCVKSRKEI